MDDGYARVALSIIITYFPRSIGGTVVDQYYFKIIVSLAYKRIRFKNGFILRADPINPFHASGRKKNCAYEKALALIDHIYGDEQIVLKGVAH